MLKPTGTIWPELDKAYVDEFGYVEPEVYRAAGTLWGKGEKYAVSTLGDAPTGLRLMIKASAIVSRKRAEPDTHIENLAAYLFQTYKRLVLAELEKENGHRQREWEMQAEMSLTPGSVVKDIDRRILVEQIMSRMDAWMREIFELLILGYSFEEIGRARNKSGHLLRNKFNKQLKRLMKQLETETHAPRSA